MVNPSCCVPLLTAVKIVAVISVLWSVPFLAEEIFLVAVHGCDALKAIKERHPLLQSIKSSPSQPAHQPLHKELLYNVTESNNQSNIENGAENIFDQVENLVEEVDAGTPICKLKGSDLIVSGMWVLTWVVDLGLAAILFFGAYKKSVKLCLIWFHVRFALLVFRIVFLFLTLIAGRSLLYKIPIMVLCVFRIYSLWVVSRFIDELRKEKTGLQELKCTDTL